jgi:TP901 family phage tail tape measure protein
MALLAGEVYALLGGRYSPSGFASFDKAMQSSHAKATAFERNLDSAGKKSSNALHLIGKAALYTGVGVSAAAVGIGVMVKKAADFESQMSSLGAVTNANAKQMAQFRAQALKAGADTKYSALQAAQAQTELAKGGLSVAQIMGGGLKAALALAAAGDLDLADAATFAVNAIKLFNLHGEDSMKVADQLATAANATTADVKDFGMALTQGGTAAKSAGLDFTNTVAILEALASIGVKNSDAGTSLKTTLAQLATPTKKANGLMEEMGLKFFDANGKMKDAVSISTMLRDKWSGLTNEQRLAAASTLAGTDGMRTLLALYQVGPEKLQRYENGLQRQGSAAEVAAKKQDNLAGKIENLKGSLETAAIIVGSELIPPLTHAAEKLTDFVNAAAQRGDIKKLGEDLAHGLEEGAKAIPTVIDGIQLIGHTIGMTVHEVEALVSALGGIDNVGPMLLGAVVGLGGLRVASAVLPPILGLARGLNDVALAARAGGLAFAGETLVSMVNPATALVVAFAGLGAAIGYLISRESAEEQIAKAVAAAKRDQANATRELTSAESGAASATIGAQQAHLRLADAHDRTQAALKESGRGSREYRTALLDERRAGLDWVEAHKRMTDEQKKFDDKRRNESVPAMRQLDIATKELARQGEGARQPPQGRACDLAGRRGQVPREGAQGCRRCNGGSREGERPRRDRARQLPARAPGPRPDREEEPGRHLAPVVAAQPYPGEEADEARRRRPGRALQAGPRRAAPHRLRADGEGGEDPRARGQRESGPLADPEPPRLDPRQEHQRQHLLPRVRQASGLRRERRSDTGAEETARARGKDQRPRAGADRRGLPALGRVGDPGEPDVPGPRDGPAHGCDAVDPARLQEGHEEGRQEGPQDPGEARSDLTAARHVRDV